MRAFIPNAIPEDPSYVIPVPNQAGKWMIPGPAPTGIDLLPVDLLGPYKDCYLTDNRQFMPDKLAASKVSTEFRIVINHGQLSIEPATADAVHIAGTSTRLDCKTGGLIAEKPGSFAGSFGVRALGNPAVAGTKIQIIGQAAIGNPHLVAPMIDYSFDSTYDASTRKLKYSISHGRFPAFEAYAFRGNSKPVPLVRVPAGAVGAWGLIDGGLGLAGPQNLTGEVQL